MTDIRTSRRFPVQLPLKVLGGTNVPVGTTANISAAGVYLWIDGGLEGGASIDFEDVSTRTFAFSSSRPARQDLRISQMYPTLVTHLGGESDWLGW